MLPRNTTHTHTHTSETQTYNGARKTHRRKVSQRGSVEALEQVIDVVEGARARGLPVPPGSPQFVGGVGGRVLAGEGVVEVVEVAVGGPSDALLVSQRQVDPTEQLCRLVHGSARV